MALTLALTSSNTSTVQLTLTDSTGAYNVTTNPTGWGAPNIALTDVLYAYLVVTTPGGVVYPIDIINDLSIDFSTVAYDELIYNVTHDLLGGTVGTTLPDGIYEVTYQISTRNITYGDFDAIGESTTDKALDINVMTYYTVQGQVFERIAEIPTYYKCADCDNLYVKETTTMFMLLQSLIAASTYSTTVKFELILEALQDIISFDADLDEDCGC